MGGWGWSGKHLRFTVNVVVTMWFRDEWEKEALLLTLDERTNERPIFFVVVSVVSAILIVFFEMSLVFSFSIAEHCANDFLLHTMGRISRKKWHMGICDETIKFSTWILMFVTHKKARSGWK